MSGLLQTFNSSILAGVRSYFPRDRPANEVEQGRPKTHAEWVARYNRLEAAYLGTPYTVEEVRRRKLFRAVDPTGELIAITRRLTRDVQHVVDTDARALTNLRIVSSDSEGEDSVDVLDARAVWERSGIKQTAPRWARMAAGLGDIVWEAVRLSGSKPYDVHIVGYDPRFVPIREYDVETGTKLKKVVIEVPYEASDEAGVMVDHLYRRELDDEEVNVFLDGVLVEEQSGPHGLGVTPAVHVPFTPWTDPSHGLWAAEGLEDALALVDSLLTQVLAVGNRYGSPMWLAKGFRLANGADLNFGRVLPLPAGADFTAMEPGLSGLRTLLDAVQSARSMVRETLPEFLFTDAGASASGSSLNFRATAFVSKMEDVRTAYFDGLVRVTEFALAMERNATYDPDAVALSIDAPPVLPVNVSTQVDTLIKVVDAGALSISDFIRHLQSIGIVPQEVDPTEYAKEVAAEQAVLANIEAQALADVANQIAGLGAEGLPPIGEEELVVPPGAGPDGSTTIAGSEDEEDAEALVREAEEDEDESPA